MPIELPLNVQQLIREYSKPVTRGDWRKGSATNEIFKFSCINKYLHDIYLKYYNGLNDYTQSKYNLIENTYTLPDDIINYGESIFNIYPYNTLVVYRNYYFILRHFSLLKNADTFLIRQLYNGQSIHGPNIYGQSIHGPPTYDVEVEYWN